MTDFSYLFPSFPNYTEDMYKGNEPSSYGFVQPDGTKADAWSCMYGEAQTYNYNIICANFSPSKSENIIIVGTSMRIHKFTNKGMAELAINCNSLKDNTKLGISVFDMDKEEAVKILHKKIDDCKLWEMVRKRAKELIDTYMEGNT